MNPISRDITQEEADLLLIDHMIERKARNLNHYAGVSKTVNDQFWKQQPEDIVRILNRDPARSLAILQSDGALNNAVNAALVVANIATFTNRAPVTGREDIVFNGNEFVYVPPVVEIEE